MTVSLPDGGTAVIEYTGDVAPKVRVNPATTGIVAGDVVDFGTDVAAFERAVADMQKRMDEIQTRFDRDMRAQGVHRAELGDADASIAPGASSYSLVTTSVAGRTCTRSKRVTEDPDGGRRVERRSSGDCSTTGGAHRAPANEEADDPSRY